MASELGASQAHLSKVLSQMAHAGIVTSTRGPGGGYMLARSPGDVTLREIYELMDGPLVIERCPLGLPVCGGVCCPLGELFNRVGAEIEKGLERMTLDDYRLALAEGAAGTESTTRAREGQA